MRIENESKGKYTCSRATYTRSTSVNLLRGDNALILLHSEF